MKTHLILNFIMKSNFILVSCCAALCFISSCGNTSETKQASVEEKAIMLAKKFIIIDGHVDLPYRMKMSAMRQPDKSIDLITDTDGNFDYVKASEGGLDAPFMSIYIPSSYQAEFDLKSGSLLDGEHNRAKDLADSLIAMVEGIATAYPEKFALAYSPADVEKNFAEGKISLPMGMENGAPLGDSIENVKYFYDRGIRYITLTHGKPNQICDSSYDTTKVWNGLSPFGEEVVKEMNRVGIIVDVSHISDSTFYDVIKITKAPAIASHSSARKFIPGFERNMSEDMIKVLAENGGVIQINFGSGFISKESAGLFDSLQAHVKSWLADNNLSYGDSAAQAYIKPYTAKNYKFATVAQVADHIDYVVEIAGIDHVGFGSDFDGVGDTLPIGLKDVSDYPNLIAELLKRGYTEEDIEKICYKNVFRVWQKVEEIAAASSDQNV